MEEKGNVPYFTNSNGTTTGDQKGEPPSITLKILKNWDVLDPLPDASRNNIIHKTKSLELFRMQSFSLFASIPNHC